MHHRRTRLHLASGMAAILLAVAGGSPAPAQDYPNRAIRVVVGPSSEVTVRLIADRLHNVLGQAIIIENRAGGGGEVAAKSVSSSPPDGYTLLYATSSYTLNTALGYAGYDFVKEFEPIALFGITPFTLVVPPSLPVKNVQELIALAKSKPGELNCASSGVGTPPHLGCEMLNAMAGVKVVHVPYRNVNAAVNGMLSGQVQMLFSVSINAKPQIEAGTLRGLAVTTPKPSRIVPGLPTMDSVIPGFIITGWGSLVAPAGTPKAVIDKLGAAVQKELKDPEFAQKVTASGQEPSGVETPEQFRAFIKEDIDRWNRVIDRAGVKRGRPASN
jgi:tripartite-type tricarboxylate transporter receptor subunit TctC